MDGRKIATIYRGKMVDTLMEFAVSDFNVAHGLTILKVSLAGHTYVKKLNL